MSTDQRAAMDDRIQQAADVLRHCGPHAAPIAYAEALAATDHLKAPDDEIVSPEMRTILFAAEAVVRDWRIEGERIDWLTHQDRLIAAVDALRAATPKDGG